MLNNHSISSNEYYPLYTSQTNEILKKLKEGNSVMVIGPKQCGKTTYIQTEIREEIKKENFWLGINFLDVQSQTEKYNFQLDDLIEYLELVHFYAGNLPNAIIFIDNVDVYCRNIANIDY